MLATKRQPVGTGVDDEILNLSRQMEELKAQLKASRAHECDLECELTRCKRRLRLEQTKRVWFQKIVKFFKDSRSEDPIQFN